MSYYGPEGASRPSSPRELGTNIAAGDIVRRRRRIIGGPRIPEELAERIRTPREVLWREKLEFRDDSASSDTERREPEQSSDDSTETHSSRRARIKSIAGATIEGVFWGTTYAIRFPFWNKINRFFHNPEGERQSNQFKWALRHSLKGLLPGEEVKHVEDPSETTEPSKKLFRTMVKNPLFRQALIYGVSLALGPVASLVNSADLIWAAVKDGEYQKAVGYGVISAIDVLPVVASVALLHFFGLGVATGGIIAAINILGAVTPNTNTFLNEPFQRAYTTAHVDGLLQVADSFFANGTAPEDEGKRKAISKTINDFIAGHAVKHPQYGSGPEAIELYRQDLLANIHAGIQRLSGESEDGKKTDGGEIAKEWRKYHAEEEIIRQLEEEKNPRFSVKKRLSHGKALLEARAKKIVFKIQIENMEKKLGQLRQLEKIISESAHIS